MKKLFELTDKQYDILKWIAMIVLPAIGAFYFTLANIWGLPYAEQIVGTITAVDTLLGALLGISTSQYNKAKKLNQNDILWTMGLPLRTASWLAN